MKIFYGSAIQGAKDRGERAGVHKTLIALIKGRGHEIVSEHATGKSKEETSKLLEKSIGPLPPAESDRTTYIRRKMIEAIEGDIDAAIFEVSTPSTGAGIEIAHAYLRPRSGLPKIPILSLYQRDFWPNNLSSMICGISRKEIPNFHLREYVDLEDAKSCVLEFLSSSCFEH